MLASCISNRTCCVPSAYRFNLHRTPRTASQTSNILQIVGEATAVCVLALPPLFLESRRERVKCSMLTVYLQHSTCGELSHFRALYLAAIRTEPQLREDESIFASGADLHGRISTCVLELSTTTAAGISSLKQLPVQISEVADAEASMTSIWRTPRTVMGAVVDTYVYRHCPRRNDVNYLIRRYFLVTPADLD